MATWYTRGSIFTEQRSSTGPLSLLGNLIKLTGDSENSSELLQVIPSGLRDKNNSTAVPFDYFVFDFIGTKGRIERREGNSFWNLIKQSKQNNTASLTCPITGAIILWFGPKNAQF